MIRVGFVTSYGDRCGISEYAKNLMRYFNDPDVNITILNMTIAEAANRAQDFDIIHVNECGFVMPGFTNLDQHHARGAKVMMTQHATNPKENRNPFSILFDQVVIHEPHAQDGFRYIPQGAPVPGPRWGNPEISNTIGTSGFPLPHKNLPRLVSAAKAAGLRVNVLGPESHHVDANLVEQQLMSISPDTRMDKRWLTDDEVVTELSKNLANVYAYTSHTPGPSAAAFWGLASGRPLVVSRCNQFEHLFPYEDQIYFIESADPSVEQIEVTLRQVMKDFMEEKLKYPVDLLNMHRWDNCAAEYAKVYKELVTK